MLSGFFNSFFCIFGFFTIVYLVCNWLCKRFFFLSNRWLRYFICQLRLSFRLYTQTFLINNIYIVWGFLRNLIKILNWFFRFLYLKIFSYWWICIKTSIKKARRLFDLMILIIVIIIKIIRFLFLVFKFWKFNFIWNLFFGNLTYFSIFTNNTIITFVGISLLFIWFFINKLRSTNRITFFKFHISNFFDDLFIFWLIQLWI